MMNARQAAYESVYSVIYGGAYSNLELGSKDVAPQERAFATRLTMGVIERKLTLDYIISKFCKKPKPRVFVILEIGVYQIYFMEKVPERAAVNECVKLAKENALGAYAAFVNAVLRKAAENKIEIEKTEDWVRYSVPEEILSMWKRDYGSDTVKEFLPNMLKEAPLFVITNTLKVTEEKLQEMLKNEGIEAKSVGGALKVNFAGDITELKEFKEGLFFVEDLSSNAAVRALAPRKGETVLDVCAAPGGKAFTACTLMQGEGNIYAFDIHESRVKLIEDGAKRLSMDIRAQKRDALEYSTDVPGADKIICDVPCSGFGTARRKPEVKYKGIEGIKELPEIQLKILGNAVKYLKPEGRVLYSTCTLNKNENESVVERFLDKNKAFENIEMKTKFPTEEGGDGFFYAILQSKV